MVKPPADDKAPASGGGKAFRSRFWNGSNSTQRHTVVQGEPIGKQFNANRQQGAETWLKPAEEENGDIPFSYTPFKTNTLGRESQVRGRTPQPNESIDHRANVPKEQMRHSGTLTRPAANANVIMQRPPPQTNGAPVVHRPQNAHAPPAQQQQQHQQQQQQRPSPPLANGHNGEPKMMEQPASRLASRASAYTMSAFAGGRSRSDVTPADQRAAPTAAAAYHAQQWTTVETAAPQAQQMQQQPPMNMQQQHPQLQSQHQQQPQQLQPQQLQPQFQQQWSNVPQPTHWGGPQGRPASAMPSNQMPRAHSRAASEMLIVGGSRYQSYTTLPRPEMLDIVDHPGYIGGGGYPVDGGVPPPMPLHPDMKASCFDNIGLPPAMYSMHPRQQQDMMAGKQQKMENQKASMEAVDDDENNCETINWSLVLKLAVLLMLLSMVVFGLGLARVLLKAKWGLGVELVYAVFVFIAGLLGLIGAVKRHYCSVVACFSMSAISCIIAIPPMIIGLTATVPWTFSNVDKSYFVSDSEPYAVDIALSAMCLLQISIGLIVAGVGCCTAGRVLARTDEMYLTVGAHSNASHTEEKSTSTMNLIQ